MDCLSEAYRTEQKEYYMNTSAWGNVHPTQLLGPGVCFKKYDLLTVTLDELKVGCSPCGVYYYHTWPAVAVIVVCALKRTTCVLKQS